MWPTLLPLFKHLIFLDTMMYTTLLPFSGSNKRATWRIQSGCDAVWSSRHLCMFWNWPTAWKVYTKGNQNDCRSFYTKCLFMITLYTAVILSPLNIVCVLPIQKELHLTQCTLSCDPEDCFRYCILTWILTVQRGVTSTARHGENITCRGVTSTARHGARSHSFVYISTI